MKIAAMPPRWYFFAVRRFFHLLLLAAVTNLARGDGAVVQKFEGHQQQHGHGHVHRAG